MVIKLSITNYFKVWLLFVFITSFVLSNVIKGTTLAFIFSILSLPYALLVSKKKRVNFIKIICSFLVVYAVVIVLSQIFLTISNVPDYSNLVLISDDKDLVLRNSLFTQSLYLLCSWITFAFVAVYFNRDIHIKFLIWSLIAFIGYGFYLWLYYIITNENGDFISNREFAGGLIMPSQFQQIVIGGLPFARFVSLTMEPSMYVFTILPYYVYLSSLGYKKISNFILLSLLLTFSGTFVFGMIVYMITLVIITRQKQYILYSAVAIVVALFAYISIGLVRDIVNEIVISKLLQESDSGLDRFQSFYKHMVFFFDLPVLLMLFGVGFGFIRSPEFLSTILVNSGIVGFLLFFGVLLFPVYKLDNASRENIGLKCALILIAFMLITSVSEYSYPSIWVLAGIAYNKLITKQRAFKELSSHNLQTNGR